MRAQVKSKANALIAAIMAAIFAFSLSGVPASALAEGPEGETKTPSVRGVDFMQPTAQGWEVIKVDNLGDQEIYVQVKKNGKPLSNPMKYTADMNSLNDGSGVQVAQIVAVQIMANQNATGAQTAADLLGPDVADRGTYTVEVTDAFMQGNTLFNGTVYPVYANITDVNGNIEDTVLLGIRTTDSPDPATLKKNLGVGQSYYKQAEGQASPTSYSLVSRNGIDNEFESGAFYVTYEQNSSNTVEGSINYVNADTGEVVKTEKVSGIGKDGKTVSIMKSFSAVVKDGDKEKVQSYRVISRLAGEKVTLSYTNASYTVQVVPLDENTTYPVTINYRSMDGTLLWSDNVDVKGKGYRYTLPNTFSMNKGSKVDAADGVNLYHLEYVQGGQVVNPGEPAEGGITSQDGVSVATASNDNGTIINLTNNMTDDQFVLDENDHRVINAYYQNQDADKEVEFTLIEVDGETGEQLTTITATVDPNHVFSYTPEKKEINGKTYVPWAGNTEEITYSWESLGQSVDLLQYVYYVPEDYVPGDAYGVTVQYVNVANGAVLRSETVNIDPEITNFVEITGPQSFTQDGSEYVRLDGQDTAIRHAFLSPNRTYTIYYRDVDDVINAQTMIDRVQIIETTIPGTGGGLTAAPTEVEDAGDGPDVDAGVGAGDGTVVINDDDNPLANLDGQDTTTERTIAENENPLASGVTQNGFAIASFAIGAIALIGIVAYFLLRRRKQATDNQNA
ncbi:hypothetical protein [Anaerotardibacter muris]|uniref:hypothetical protein n=1 Tax=Anaerotardibacter muris TaxID=2941505 RepID=UPI00203C1B13|nr:hypothetical protein [Anaerotardibacter muris]